jgi:hypothetical protein
MKAAVELEAKLEAKHASSPLLSFVGFVWRAAVLTLLATITLLLGSVLASAPVPLASLPRQNHSVRMPLMVGLEAASNTSTATAITTSSLLRDEASYDVALVVSVGDANTSPKANGKASREHAPAAVSVTYNVHSSVLQKSPFLGTLLQAQKILEANESEEEKKKKEKEKRKKEKKYGGAVAKDVLKIDDKLADVGTMEAVDTLINYLYAATLPIDVCEDEVLLATAARYELAEVGAACDSSSLSLNYLLFLAVRTWSKAQGLAAAGLGVSLR